MHIRTLIHLLALTLLPACGNKSVATIESCKEQWYAAVNQRKPELLYGLLDS